jgi:hypothetical protein
MGMIEGFQDDHAATFAASVAVGKAGKRLGSPVESKEAGCGHGDVIFGAKHEAAPSNQSHATGAGPEIADGCRQGGQA